GALSALWRGGLRGDHWGEWVFAASRVRGVGGGGPAGGRGEIRPGCQGGGYRWRSPAEAATTGLLVDERAQARARIEARHCRQGCARTLGRIEYLRESQRRFGQQARHATRGGEIGGYFADRYQQGSTCFPLPVR